MQARIPAVLMRGGTSKALFFHANHLPAESSRRDAVLLAAYGSPDPHGKQSDGLGGGIATASKVAIISPATDANTDVCYRFGQVSIDRALVDFKSNCGNICAAVGPFAVDAGLVAAREPVTTVRIHQANTGKRIIAEVPVKDGRFDEAGTYAIPGVPGSASRIALHFLDPGGAVTGALFPTGHLTDRLTIPGAGTIPVTIMDAANPVVFVQAASIGLTGAEIAAIECSDRIRAILEMIRGTAAVRVGLADSVESASRSCQAVPKIAMVAPAGDYSSTGGEFIAAGNIDLMARMLSMGRLHPSYAVTAAICTAGAAMIPGTVVNTLLGPLAHGDEEVRIGHPAGILAVGTRIEADGNRWIYHEAIIGRTARRLMEGYVLIPENVLHSQ